LPAIWKPSGRRTLFRPPAPCLVDHVEEQLEDTEFSRVEAPLPGRRDAWKEGRPGKVGKRCTWPDAWAGLRSCQAVVARRRKRARSLVEERTAADLPGG